MSAAAFFAQILAVPGDRFVQQVYADWLEERGDPRGEFVRLQAELAVAPPDSLIRNEREPRLRELLLQLAPLPDVLVDLAALTIRRPVFDDVPSLMAEMYNVFPLGREGRELIVAIGVPTRGEVARTVRDLEFLLGERVIHVLAHRDQVAAEVAKGTESIEEMLLAFDGIAELGRSSTSIDL